MLYRIYQGKELPPTKPGGSGYIRITYKGENIQAHRVIWYLVYGRWPVDYIDHINQKKDDNRICNLRECTQSENQANRTTSATIERGLPKGVYRSRNRFMARITKDGDRIYLGTYDTPEEASNAYQAEAKELFGEFARKPPNEPQVKYPKGYHRCCTCPAGIPITMMFCEDCRNTTKPKPTNEPQMTALEKLMSRIVRDVDVAGSLEDPEIVSYNCSHNEFENIRIDLGATTQEITMQYDGYELTYASLSVAAPNYKDEEQERIVYVFDISTERYAKINTPAIGTVLALAGLAGAAIGALCSNQAPKIRAAEIEETQEEPMQETMKQEAV